MATITSESFCFLIICFLVCSSEAQEKITAELGKNVILPCKNPNINNIIRAVEWIRPDQDPEYVLFYRDGHFDPHGQHPSYKNRVDLQDKEMKDGDFSLILKNVKMEDPGTYICRVFQKGKNDPISTTYVEVYLPAQEKITADLGKNVILPCKVPNKYTIITAVEWIRPDQDPEHVLVYRNGHLDPDNQNPSYQNRVDLQDNKMKDGDVSLILKNVKMEDNGTYECHVFQREKIELISNINLEVHLSGEKFEGGNTGIIGGSVVGVILLLAVVPVGFLICRRHTKKNPNLPLWIYRRSIRQNHHDI